VSIGEVDLEDIQSPTRQMDLASSHVLTKKFIANIQQDIIKATNQSHRASLLHEAIHMPNLNFASKDQTEPPSSRPEISEKPSKMHLKLIDGFENKNRKSFHWILQRLLEKKAEKPADEEEQPRLSIHNSPNQDPKTPKSQLEPPPESRTKEKKPSINPKPNKDAESFKRTIANIRGQSFKDPKRSRKINITFWDYIKSYVWKSKSLNKKLVLIQEGMERINERLDIFNVLRKLREVDKLKVLLFEGEQLVLFEGLPRPELSIKEQVNPIRSRKSITHDQLKNSRFITEIDKNELVALSYESLKEKNSPNIVDQKLIEIYEDMFE